MRTQSYNIIFIVVNNENQSSAVGGMASLLIPDTAAPSAALDKQASPS